MMYVFTAFTAHLTPVIVTLANLLLKLFIESFRIVSIATPPKRRVGAAHEFLCALMRAKPMAIVPRARNKDGATILAWLRFPYSSRVVLTLFRTILPDTYMMRRAREFLTAILANNHSSTSPVRVILSFDRLVTRLPITGIGAKLSEEMKRRGGVKSLSAMFAGNFLSSTLPRWVLASCEILRSPFSVTLRGAKPTFASGSDLCAKRFATYFAILNHMTP
jgi:hypothetical protein